MLSNVLRSQRAIQVSMRIIDVFILLRESINNNVEILNEIDKIKSHLNKQDQNLVLVFQYLDELLKLKDNPKPRVQIGYKTGNK